MGKIRGRKRIFISDVHMGTEESVTGVGELKPWGWLSAQNAKKLGVFLERVQKDRDVLDVVILGDLFDDWVIPPQVDPDSAGMIAKIARAPQNKPIIDGLRAVSREKNLIYVNGNHDMLLTADSFAEALGVTRFEFIQSSPGIGVFERDGIAAEHGNAYCLFNAPDEKSEPGHSLPLGYFVSRIGAYVAAVRGVELDPLTVIPGLVKRLGAGNELARATFQAIVNLADMADDEFLMNGVNGYAGTMSTELVTTIFDDIYRRWPAANPGNVSAALSAANELGSLQPAADKIYYEPGKARIVIFGHTHRATMLPVPNIERSVVSDRASEFIYANTGTWRKGKPTHYVETILEEDRGRHYVRLMRFKKRRTWYEDELLLQRYVLMDSD